MAPAMYFRTSYRRHNVKTVRNVFVNKNIGKMITLVCNAFRIQWCRAHFKYFQVHTHVQTARESPDLNIDFRSFDNGCKQLYE